MQVFRTKMTYCDNKYGPVDCFEKFNSSTYNCAKNSYYSESLGGWVVDFPEQNMPFDKYYDEEKYKGRSPASLANINYVCSDY